MADATAQLRGRAGGLTTAARAASPQAMTEAARAGRWQKYLDKIPDFVTDPADRIRRAELLLKADMAKLALKSAKARRLRAELAAVEDELDASGLLDAGRQ